MCVPDMYNVYILYHTLCNYNLEHNKAYTTVLTYTMNQSEKSKSKVNRNQRRKVRDECTEDTCT